MSFEHAFPWLALILGLCLGSFATACVHRYLAGQTVLDPPRSYCPHCDKRLTWRENIPLLSYLLQGGRCSCARRMPIGLRYPAMEALSGAFALGFALKFGPGPAFLVYLAFSTALIVASFIDFAEYILPDGITLTGTAAALACAPLFLGLDLFDSALGAILGAGLFWALQLGYRLLRKDEGMGTGDIKLMALLGALNGWQALPFTVLAGALSALAASLFYLRREGGQGMKTAVPFGPFLSLAGLLAPLVGDRVTAWYLGLL
ncbi:MAG: prepilin peptidase [Thermodesulfobacteriota bacterium]